MKATYDSTPIEGYGDGLVKSTESVVQRKDNNDWIEIGEYRFNVHPYRSDLEGYPVRWIERMDTERLDLSTMPKDVSEALNAHHYYACFGLGWATAPTREEAISKLVTRFESEFKKMITNEQKDGGHGAYIWSCKVNAPEDGAYKISFYQPVGVETEGHKEHSLFKLTAKQMLWVDGSPKVVAGR